MTGNRDADPGAARAATVRLQDLLAAIALLTIAPLRRPDPKSPAFARATLFFPLVGLLMGGVLAALNSLLAPRLPNWAVTAVLVALWVLLSGEVPVCTSGGRRGAHANRPVGILAVVAMLGGTLAKFVCLAVQGPARPAALLFAPTLARWSMVVLATGARDAQAPAQKFNAAVGFREFALTSVCTLAVVFAVAEALGIVIVVCVAGVTLAMRLLLHRWAGGVSWLRLRRGCELVETSVVLLFAVA